LGGGGHEGLPGGRCLAGGANILNFLSKLVFLFYFFGVIFPESIPVFFRVFLPSKWLPVKQLIILSKFFSTALSPPHFMFCFEVDFNSRLQVDIQE